MEKKRDFLSLFDVSDVELAQLLRRAEELRFLRGRREPHPTRPGRMLALIFEKASTRTRVSFEVAIAELGGHAVVLGKNDSQLGRGEPIKDTARVMARYCHGIMVRTFGHERVEELAKYSSVPVLNGLTDLLHPCQVLADLQTVYAHLAGRAGNPSVPAPDVLPVLRSVRYAWVGDGNNMANTWIEAAGLLGLDLARPPIRTLLCGCTDDFYAQARVNRAGLQFGVPTMCAQVYAEGRGAEITFTYPGMTPACHRCVLRSRYDAYLKEGYSNTVTSDGTPISSTTRLNSTKLFVALALLHHGTAHPRWGRLLERIGNRNLVQLRLDPDLALPVFERVLCGDRDRVFSDEAVWLPQQPEGSATGRTPCPDCGGTGDLRSAIGTLTDTRLQPEVEH